MKIYTSENDIYRDEGDQGDRPNKTRSFFLGLTIETLLFLTFIPFIPFIPVKRDFRV
jgi:hypothetical protein